MHAREQIVCQCGGQLSRPLPTHCPHCGARITAVRRRWWPVVWPIMAIGLMLAGLLWFVSYWASR